MGGANGALFPVHRPSESHADMCNFQFFPYLCDNVPDVVEDPRRCFSRVDRFPPPAKYFPFPAIDDELTLGASVFVGTNVTGCHLRMTPRVHTIPPGIAF